MARIDSSGIITSKNQQSAIAHPLDPEGTTLVHAAMAGPESAVFYRGEGRLSGGEATVGLPPYFEALTQLEGRSVQVTPRFDRNDGGSIAPLAASGVEDGGFLVRAITDANPTQRFYWEVKAVRNDVESLRVEVPNRTG
jgi:hypothetical protein